jgi:uncharacterized membrane protein YphA (DoxX/SURF4 family)
MGDEGLEGFGTTALRLGLGGASLGMGAVALARGLGWDGPLAPWASGLGAAPLGEPLNFALAAALLILGWLLVADKAAAYVALALAVLLAASLVVSPPGTLGSIQDLGLLGGAIALIVFPSSTLARLPAPLTGLLAAIAAHRRLALRLGLALVFLLTGWGKFADTSSYVDLLAATGGVAGWPVVGGQSPTALMLYVGAGELFLSGLLLWGPPARLASAIASVVLLLVLLGLHVPSMLTAKAIGLLGAAIAGYCWASGATALENAQIGWLRASAPGSADRDESPAEQR